MHQAYVLLGSNIDPVENTRRALDMLAKQAQVVAISTCWETSSVGYDGPNFINAIVLIEVDLGQEELKRDLLGGIEQALGRVRTTNKNAPRTIDLDPIVFDGEVVDGHLWRQAHVAAPMAELLPNLPHPETGRALKDIAAELQASAYAVPRPGLLKTPGPDPKDFENH